MNEQITLELWKAYVTIRIVKFKGSGTEEREESTTTTSKYCYAHTFVTTVGHPFH